MTASTSAVDLGFELAATRDALFDWLMANGAVPPSDMLRVRNADLLFGSESDVALWARARDAAMVHLCLHGVVADERNVDENEPWRVQPSCHQSPCAVAAVSFALEELCGYWWTEIPREIASKIGHLASVLGNSISQSLRNSIIRRPRHCKDSAASRCYKRKDASHSGAVVGKGRRCGRRARARSRVDA